jgi:hypothetical protein
LSGVRGGAFIVADGGGAYASAFVPACGSFPAASDFFPTRNRCFCIVRSSPSFRLKIMAGFYARFFLEPFFGLFRDAYLTTQVLVMLEG